MKAILICRTAKLLEELGVVVRGEGYEVTRGQLREAGRPLRPLLEDSDADLAIIDSPDDRADLTAIESMTATHPAMAVIILSPTREAHSLLAAMQAGVREVLASPPGAGEVLAALKRMSRHKSGHARGRVIAFVSCKGGSGATFIATNIAYLLAVEQRKNTVLLDLDLQYGDASYFVSDGYPKTSLSDLTRDVQRLDANLWSASIQQIAPNFSLLPAPEDPEAALAVTSAQLDRVLDLAVENHELVVLDVERVIDSVAIKALDRADLIFLVAENMLPHARDAKRLVRTLRTLGYPDGKLRLVINRYEPHGALSLAQVEGVAGLKVARTLPSSPSDVTKAVNTGVPLVTVNPNNPVAVALRAMAAELAGKPAQPAHGWIGRLIGQH